MSLNSITNSFADKKLKDNLKKVLLEKFIAFEKKWKKRIPNPN